MSCPACLLVTVCAPCVCVCVCVCACACVCVCVCVCDAPAGIRKFFRVYRVYVRFQHCLQTSLPQACQLKTSACVTVLSHTSAYVGIRRHTSAYVSLETSLPQARQLKTSVWHLYISVCGLNTSVWRLKTSVLVYWRGPPHRRPRPTNLRICIDTHDVYQYMFSAFWQRSSITLFFSDFIPVRCCFLLLPVRPTILILLHLPFSFWGFMLHHPPFLKEGCSNSSKYLRLGLVL